MNGITPLATRFTILEAMRHPDLFGPWFQGASWAAWEAFLAALFGLPLTEPQRAAYQACTARAEPPAHRSDEAWLVCGRRAGKSRILAFIAIFLSISRDWTPHLAPGERGTILVIAADRKQAGTIMRYVTGMLEVPALRSMVERATAEEIDLAGRITVEIGTASFRAVRGRTIVAALCDEVAFWRSEESANPDVEILAALRPAMATVPGAMLLCASSPYARRGALWDAFRRWHGKPDAPALVWRAATRTMNPTVPQRVIDEAIERDPANAAAEYGAEFRTDVETFVSREVVDACTPPGRYELPPVSSTRYVSFVDPSGGSADSMTLAIAHRDGDRAILDAIREVRPPFSPEGVVGDFAALLKTYRIHSVTGDRYAGEWVREPFRKHSVDYKLAERAKSDLYRDMLPALNSGKVELLDLPRLTAQLCGLERRTARGGKDSIDHPPGAHDDVANVVAGVLCAAISKPGAMVISDEALAFSRLPTRAHSPARPSLTWWR